MKAKRNMRCAGQVYAQVLLVIAVLITGTTVNADSSIQKISRSEEMMDTYFTITVYSDKPETAETAITEAFNKIKKIESELSIYSEDSELARLNRKKHSIPPRRI